MDVVGLHNLGRPAQDHLKGQHPVSNQDYVLVSVCRDEQAYIDGLIDSVAAQTVRPKRWVIVDDGSTDSTAARVMDRARELPGLELLRMPTGRRRTFASKVYGLEQGSQALKNSRFAFIGFLDADIRMAPDYYARLIRQFETDPGLGLAGGTVIDQYRYRTENIRKGSEDFHVAGGVQFFRRACFDAVGGYLPVEAGGEDTIAEVTAMMRGWRVRTFPEMSVLHLRPEGVGAGNVLARGIRWGRRFYLLGYHPLFYFGQCARRVVRRPFLVGSACQLYGFVLASIRGGERPVSNQFVQFHRQMQMARLRDMFVPVGLRKGRPAVGLKVLSPP